MMIDWTTLEIPFSHNPIPSGKVIKMSADGEMEEMWDTRVQVLGSYDSCMYIRSAGSDKNKEGEAAYLHLDGNPSKFLQGHNVVGDNNVITLTDMAVAKIFKNLNFLYTGDLKSTILAGDFKVSRIDITSYIEFHSESDALAWQQAAESVATSRQGKFVRKGTTIYMGKNSRRVSIKIYSKYLELTQAKKGHKLPITLPHKQQLLDYAEKKLRIEVVCRSLFLKDLGLNQAKELTPTVLGELYAKQVGKLEMNAQVRLQPHEAMNLPKAILTTYMLWKDGTRMRDCMSKTQFFRHRKILKEYGIDIKVSPKKLESNIVPLIRKIEAKPVEMPKWSESVGLIYN